MGQWKGAMDRLKKIDKIRKDLKSGVVTIGSWMQIPHPSIAEIIGQAGYDWVAVDLEHGSISIQQLPDLFRSLARSLESRFGLLSM